MAVRPVVALRLLLGPVLCFADSVPGDTIMATVAPKMLPHTPALPSLAPQTEGASPAPAAASPSPVYRGDRWGLVFWLGCAALLIALHVGQHVYYLLR
jgi:hypothetical protein